MVSPSCKHRGGAPRGPRQVPASRGSRFWILRARATAFPSGLNSPTSSFLPAKLGGAAVAVLLGFVGVSGGVGNGPDPRRAGWRDAYRAPTEIPFPAENPYTAAKADLGRRLFFDPILSGDGTRACAKCHIPDLAWGD